MYFRDCSIFILVFIFVSCARLSKEMEEIADTDVNDFEDSWDEDRLSADSGANIDASIEDRAKIKEEEDRFCDDDIFSRYLIQKTLSKNLKIHEIKKLNQFSEFKNRDEAKASIIAKSVLKGPYVSILSGLPVVATPQVDHWIRYFESRAGREIYIAWLVKSKSIERILIPLLIKEGLPEELFFLAMIESGFNNMAYSRAKAIGTWQFMKATAMSYNLRVDYWIDERRDPIKSTLAAASYLKDLYIQFGDWYLAIAAYNAGPGKIRNAIQKTGSRDFWILTKTRYLKKETRQYVPKMLAALIIASNPEKYGFWISKQADDHPQLEAISLERPVELKEIAEKLDIPVEKLKQWNPELIKFVTPPVRSFGENNGEYKIKLPLKYLDHFNQIKKGLSYIEIQDMIIYEIKKGDSLSKIARRYQLKVSQIISANPDLNLKKRLRLGQTLAIPIPAIVKKIDNNKVIKSSSEVT
ncbi:MAG: transglycosylase SLT domain-containing protein [Oligoflexales bacterium]|nr:transglycosylase SLT domain-containing protein [Oligoflexales bacterium]